MEFKATFNNISVISRQSVSLVAEKGKDTVLVVDQCLNSLPRASSGRTILPIRVPFKEQTVPEFYSISS